MVHHRVRWRQYSILAYTQVTLPTAVAAYEVRIERHLQCRTHTYLHAIFVQWC